MCRRRPPPEALFGASTALRARR